MQRITKYLTLLACLLCTAAGAQTDNTQLGAEERKPAPLQVEVGRSYARPNGLAVVNIWFAGNGRTSGFGGDLVIGNPDAVADIDLSGCLGDYTARVGTCVHPGGDESRIRILLADDRDTALERFSGTIVLELAPHVRPGTVIPLTWDREVWDVAGPEAGVKATDGRIIIGRPGSAPNQ